MLNFDLAIQVKMKCVRPGYRCVDNIEMFL